MVGISQPRTQALSTTRLAGGKTLVQAGHVSPRFWEITIGTYRGREGKCGVRVQNNTRSVNKATQRTVPSRVENWKSDGGVLIITWRCCHDHAHHVWSSSKVLCIKKEQSVYTTTIMIAVVIIITGGNYEKFSLF